MHDCEKTKEQLVDLVFDELESGASRRVLSEIESCPACLTEYRSMTETLRVFDRVADIAQPDESYWAGYESRLRVRLQPARPSLKQRLADWLAGFELPTLRPLPLVAGLALLLLAVGWWNWQRRQLIAPAPIVPEVAHASPTPLAKPELQDATVAVTRKTESVPNKRKHIAKVPKPDNRPAILREEPSEATVALGADATRFEQPVAVNSLFDPETSKHFEKAQLLLRAFRNASAAKGDLAYEKQLSRRLLYQNILLRRDAEAKGNLPAEEALNSLEPFLLDIANLPDKPSPDELSGIRQRLQRKEMIASLQIYAAQPALPTFQNP